ncbi:MAG: YqgE/AlgH family protein [Bacteroidetes bacterium]|jgi:putative transcriptional regulator|nr:YqgE/AlgH family protein [Bacteroidota bacterium]MBU1579477.1 YqgE/AlgH family protein [Bacteroidota bacterium]MBU2557957.1 YqgE/AlgH family protein [Bacteroidota bacterium]MDA3942456.1 YqgE/AlgH family protein [Bacteroidota bacterium]
MNIDKLLHIKSNTITPQKGKVLLAEPLMGDFYFGRSVVLLIEHEEDEGSFGLIMNKAIDKTFNELVLGFPAFDAPVYLGGPVQKDMLFYIHKLGDLIPNSLAIMKGLYWGGDIEAVQSLIETGMMDPSQIRFFLGYSGWETKQLTEELKRNSWLVADASVNALFRTKSHLMWRHFVRRMGTNYEKWLKLPEDYSLN